MKQFGARRKIVELHSVGYSVIVLECGHKKTYPVYRRIPKEYAFCQDCKSRWDKESGGDWPD